MVVEILDRLRLAIAVDIGRCRIDMHVHGKQLALDEIRLLRLAQADSAVGMAHVDVQLFVVEDQLDRHLRIELQEFLHLVRQPALTEADGCGHAQLAGRFFRRFGQLHLHGLQLQQDVMRRAVEQFALFGEDQARAWRWKSLTPISCSSDDTWRLMADCDRCSLSRHG